jgi:hypothetical protein
VREIVNGKDRDVSMRGDGRVDGKWERVGQEDMRYRGKTKRARSKRGNTP